MTGSNYIETGCMHDIDFINVIQRFEGRFEPSLLVSFLSAY